MRALLIAGAIAALQIGMQDGWAGAQSIADFFRTALLLSNAVALVLVVVDAVWPSVRRTFEFHGAAERAASTVSVTLGISVSMIVVSYLQVLLEGTAGAHHEMTTGAHHGMSPIEHAVREGGAMSPIVLIVVALAPLAVRWIQNVRRTGLRPQPMAVVRWSILAGLIGGVTMVASGASPASAAVPVRETCSEDTAVRAYDVAAVNAFIPYSRWGNDSGVPQNGPDGFPHLGDGDPNGLLFVLQQDKAAVKNWYAPIVGDQTDGYAGDPAEGRRVRPRPLVLRANAGECIQVTLTNELQPAQMAPFLPQVDPRVSMHAYGVSYDPNNGDGSSVGYNDDTTVGVGETLTYFWRAPASEGLYLFRDMGMPAGADHDGGGSEHGLYGGLAVEPAGARWFDPTTGAELSSSVPDQQYASVAGQSGDLYIQSAIAVADGRRFRESVEISQGVIPVVGAAEGAEVEEPEVEEPEVEAEAEVEDPAYVAVPKVEAPERFGFNFGSEAEYKRLEYRDNWCADCVGEETGLSSWVYGDPSTVKLAGGSGPWLPVHPDYDGADPLAQPGGIAAPNVEDCGLFLTNAPDETRRVSCYTANVTDAYQGDPIKIRFGHAGVYETHVFHLHAHTWSAEPDDNGPAGSIPPQPTSSAQPRATTIDSQTYSPWTAFTADLNYGAGARVGTVGDVIFHCHLYPHFAAGFWSLLRVHDTHEDGTGANPDGHRVNPLLALREIGTAQSVPMAASVPPVKNSPSIDMPGYPRFIPGEFGSRAPQPVNGAWQREYDPATQQPILDANGVPVDAPAMRIVDGKALDPALLEATQDVSTTATEGSFTLSFGGETTEPIALPAAADAIKTALEALENIEAVIVTGAGTDVDPWKVQLVLWRSTPDLSITAEYEPTAPTKALDATVAATQATPPTPSIQTIAVDPLITEFTLSVGGATSARINSAATAADVETALEDLATVTDAEVSGTGTGTDPYRIELVTVDGTDPTITATNIAPANGEQIAISSTPATPGNPAAPAVADADLPGPAATAIAVVPQAGFDPADPDAARIAFQLAQEQHTTRKFHDPAYVAGQPVNPDKAPLPGAPVVDPCPAGARTVTYRASVIQVPLIYNEEEWVDLQGRIMVADEDVAGILDGTKKPEPFFFRANQGDCIDFEITNRTPNEIGNDAYQQLVQTNMVGGHIHLVNFDVLSSDGSSNGWNYQQAAFTEDQATFDANVIAGTQACSVEAGCTVPLPDAATYDPTDPDVQASWLSEGQTLKERWFADYELRTVFMHDHHFAAVMQNRGMFNALIIEPAGFDSRDPATTEYLQPINNPTHGTVCTDTCVGTASGAVMDMVGPVADDDFREFGLAVHDFTPLIIPPNGKASSLTLADIQNPANAVAPPPTPLRAPEGDQGGMGVNYKNAPMDIRQFPDGAPHVLGNQVDPAYTFSSRVWGDPQTPILKAYRGDNVRFRLIQGSHEEQHNFTIHGTRWQKDANDPASPYINARPIGVSEAFNIDDLAVGCGMGKAGTCFSAQPGQPRVADFLYGGAGLEDLWNGAWGMMRVFDQTENSGVGGADVLPELPDNDVSLPQGTPLPTGGVEALSIPAGGTMSDGTLPKAPVNLNSCPSGWVLTTFNVSAIDVPIEYNRYGDNDPYGLAYVLTSDVAAIRAGTKPLEPLVLRANEGDCVVVNLRNEVNWEKFAEHGDLGTLDGDAPLQNEPLPAGVIEPGEAVPPEGSPWFAGNRVSMHPSLVRADVRTSDGSTVGYSADQTAGPGESVTYVWYADEISYPDSQNPATLTDGELGGVPLTEFGDVRGHRHHGLLAALVVGPRNATFHDQITGARVRTGASVDVHVPGTAVDFRDSVIIHHNGLNLRDADGNILADPIHGDEPDAGERAISYKNAPLHHRLGLDAPIQHVGANPLGAPFNVANWGKDLANAFSSSYEIDGQPIGDPDTPIIRAYQGDPVRVHVLQSGDRARMVETEISGHNWLEHAFDAGSVRTGVQGSMATGSAFTFYLQGAGGDGQNVGDYKYGVVHAVNGMSAGSWGILRVYPTPKPGTERELSPLETSGNPYDGGNPIQVLNQSALGPDATAPTVTSVNPVDGANGVAANAAVTVTFSESVKTETVTAQSLRLLDSADATVPSTVAVRADGRAATVTPTAPLAPGAGYKVSVSVGVTDLTGNPLAAAFVSAFTVATVPPGAPTNVVAVPRTGSATVSWTPPVDIGGSPITGYRVDVFDGSGVALDALDEVADPSATSVVVDGLAVGTPYRFAVTAQNAAGVGAPSAQTEPIVVQGVQTVPDAPSGVTAVPVNGSAAGKGVVTVSWTAPNDNGSPIVSYTVYLDDGLGCAVNAPALTCDITGRTGGSFAVSVTATNDIGEGPSTETVPVTLVTKPPAPRNAVAVAGDASAVVSWKAPKFDGGSPITSYDVRVLDGAGAPVFLTGCSVTDVTSCTVNGLTNGTSYSFEVVANNASGVGKPTTTAPVTPEAAPVTVPAAPTKVKAVPVDGRAAGKGVIKVSWKAPTSDGGSPIVSYTVYLDGGLGCVVNAPELACDITGRTGGSFAVSVTASNDIGEGPASEDVAVTLLTKPPAPRKATAIAGDASAFVSWKAPKSDGGSPIMSYDVRVLDEAGTLLGLTGCSVTADARSCTVNGLTNDSSYTFAIVAHTAVGEGKPATTGAVIPTAGPIPAMAPAAPTLDALVVGDGSIVVSWVRNSDGGSPITGYIVTAAPTNGCVAEATATSCTLTGLTNGQAYFVSVQAVNAIGTSSQSGGQIATPVAAPSPPTGVSGVAGDGQVTVTWTVPASLGGAPITGYTVTASPDGQICQTMDALSCTVQGLTNGTAYTFTVTATNAVGMSPASDASALVIPVTPGTPETPVTVPPASTPTTVTAEEGSDSQSSPPTTGGSASTDTEATVTEATVTDDTVTDDTATDFSDGPTTGSGRGGYLPLTGSDGSSTLFLALVVMALGSLLILISRRRARG